VKIADLRETWRTTSGLRSAGNAERIAGTRRRWRDWPPILIRAPASERDDGAPNAAGSGCDRTRGQRPEQPTLAAYVLSVRVKSVASYLSQFHKAALGALPAVRIAYRHPTLVKPRTVPGSTEKTTPMSARDLPER